MAHPNTEAANSAMETASITLLAMIEIASQMHVYGIDKWVPGRVKISAHASAQALCS